MASFSKPYTKWTGNSFFTHTDYNRIKNNIQYLIDLSFELFPEYEYVQKQRAYQKRMYRAD